MRGKKINHCFPILNFGVDCESSVPLGLRRASLEIPFLLLILILILILLQEIRIKRKSKRRSMGSRLPGTSLDSHQSNLKPAGKVIPPSVS